MSLWTEMFTFELSLWNQYCPTQKNLIWINPARLEGSQSASWTCPTWTAARKISFSPSSPVGYVGVNLIIKESKACHNPSLSELRHIYIFSTFLICTSEEKVLGLFPFYGFYKRKRIPWYSRITLSFFFPKHSKENFHFIVEYIENYKSKNHMWNSGIWKKTAPVSWITVKASRCDNQGGVGKSNWVAPPGHWGPVQPRWAMANDPFQQLWRTPLPSPPVTGRGGGVPGPAAPAPPPPFHHDSAFGNGIATGFQLCLSLWLHPDTKICRSV